MTADRYRCGSVGASAVAILAGTLALLALPALPPLPLAAALGVAICVGAARFTPRLLVPTVLGVMSFAWTGLHARAVLEHRWPVEASGERVVATATIDTIPIDEVEGARFDATLVVGHDRAPFRARLVWPRIGPAPAAGERWRFVVALHAPRGRVNPYAHDAERHYFRERVHAVGRILPSRLNERISRGHRPLAQWRERIVRGIETAVDDRDAAALIAALAVGHTGNMSHEQWRVFNATGTAHLVAISGLHVTLFALVAFAAARLLWRALARGLPLPPRDTFAAALGLAAATAYSLLAGFSVPTQRTLLMLGAWFAVRTAARHAGAAMPLAVALVAVLAIDPFAPLAAGFWLSFLAMAAIVLATGTRFRQAPRWAEPFRVQAAVTLGLAPATLAWFGGVSLMGVVVNLVAIPIVTFVFVPLILLAVTCMPSAPVSEALLAVATELHEALWPWLTASADAKGAMLFVAPSAWWLACAAVSVLFASLPWAPAIRIASVAWLLPLAAHGQDVRLAELELTLLDTGRNASMVVRTSEQVLVRGIGEGFGTNGRSVRNVLLPFLRAHSIDRLDVLILDRGALRSVAGLNTLLANVRADRIVVDGTQAGLTGASKCRPDERWHDGSIGVHLRTIGCDLEISLGRIRVSLSNGAVHVETARSPDDTVLLTTQAKPAAREHSRGAIHFARILRTSSSGAITLRVSGSGIESLREARAQPRLWRLPPQG
jgi:competence protein ComEC